MNPRPWLCTEVRIVRANIHLTDREIAALLEDRNENGVKQARRKFGIWKDVPRDRLYPRYPTYP